MRRITVVADTSGFALLCLYAGLRAFGRRHSVPVVFKPTASVRFSRHWPGSLWIEVLTDSSPVPVFVCIDMADSGRAFSLERIEHCDVYFKRSFHREHVTQLPPTLRQKVQPYGVFYEASESGDASLLHRIVCEVIARRRFGAPAGTRELSWWAKVIGSSWLDPFAVRLMGRRLVIPDDYVANAGAPLGDTVCFQTRLWSPAEVPRENDVAAINGTRAEIVSALRRSLGARYVGGVMRSAFAREQYGDLITPHADDRASYLGILQKCRVSVVTTGIHQSVPGKLGESLAAGRCIVTEPLAYELPVPLAEGTHYLVFRNPEECVAQCRRLLNDDGLAAAMQAANREYYERHGSLTRTIERCLSRAEELGREKAYRVTAGVA
jgi:hypothetical protein